MSRFKSIESHETPVGDLVISIHWDDGLSMSTTVDEPLNVSDVAFALRRLLKGIENDPIWKDYGGSYSSQRQELVEGAPLIIKSART